MRGKITGHSHQAYNLAIWEELLGAFLGWSRTMVRQWAQETYFRHLVDPDDPEDIFYHDPPQYWIVMTLIPQTLRDKLSQRELYDLDAHILRAFDDHHRYHFPIGTDWHPYREKVSAILREFQVDLPSIESQK
jgi:hypothetical protein